MRLHEILATEELALHEPAITSLLMRLSPFMSRLAHSEESRADAALARADSITLADFINGRRDYAVTERGIAVIHANDFLARGLANIDRIFGATDYNALIAEFDQAGADPGVRGIFFDVNSPGGSVVGMQEASAAISAAAHSKPVVAYIEQLGASAAYALAINAHAIVASPSSVVGSIGTISTLVNISGLLASVGVKVEHLTGGDMKAAGTPYRDMTRKERDFLQGRVDSFTQQFYSAVRAARPAVEPSTMQGQWFTGAEAMERGLVDQVGSKADAMKAVESLAAYSGL